jgi:hypothetical protein
MKNIHVHSLTHEWRKSSLFRISNSIFSHLNVSFAHDITVALTPEECLAPDIEPTDPRVAALKLRYQAQVKELSDKLIADIVKPEKPPSPFSLEFVKKNGGRLTFNESYWFPTQPKTVNGTGKQSTAYCKGPGRKN